MEKHATLKADEFYDVRIIGAGRKDKVCEHCKKPIPKGMKHQVNTFNPDPNFVPDPTVPAKPLSPNQVAYRTYPTHLDCTEAFHKSLI